MKYFHRNYFFLLIASALTTVLWSLTYTISSYTTRFSLIMAVDGIAETSGFAENVAGKLPLSLNRSSPKTIGLENSIIQGCMQNRI